MIIASKWDVLAAKIDTRAGSAHRSWYSTPWGWKRSDAATVDLGFGEGSVTGVKITDQDGQPVPSRDRRIDPLLGRPGGLKTARVAFVARDVPAIGYRTFHASPSKGSAAGDDQATAAIPTPKPAAGATILETELYLVFPSTRRPLQAGQSWSTSRRAGRYSSGPGNVVSRVNKTAATSGSLTRVWTEQAGSP